MTYYQEKQFYENDKRKYIIKENLAFLKWFFKTIENGYEFYNYPLSLKSMQKLIDYITAWYEIKYPERQFSDSKNNIIDENVPDISKYMTVEQLIVRLDAPEYSLIDCEKFPEYCTIKTIKEKDITILDSFIVYNHNTPLSLNFTKDGKLLNYRSIHKYTHKKDIYADEVLKILKNNAKEEYDFSSLENILYSYFSNIELRHRILNFTALKILYSKNSTPENAYKRAKLFIKEFNETLGLKLKTTEVDEIIKKAKTYPKYRTHKKVK